MHHHHHHIDSDSRDDRNNSTDHPPASNRDRNQPVLTGSRHDAILLNPGPPAFYQLNTERKYINRTDKKVRWWTYGRRDENKQNKVILLVGETGAGKTTVINAMTNYLLGVKFEDQEFYQITEDEKNKDQSVSQTSEITVYEVFVEENPTSLTIIDTPGYGDTEGYEKDKQIAEYLTKLFLDKDGIHCIDAVCFVMKASQNRLSEKEHYIFHSVLSLFGRDIENNIVFLLTHSGGGPPTDALNAIEKAEIPCRRNKNNEPVHFLFDNQQKQKREKHGKYIKSAWERGEESLNEFFTLLDENNRKSVEITLDVLKKRIRLEACVSNLRERITEKELKMNELAQIQEALKLNRDKIRECESFQFTVKRVYKEKVPIEYPWWNKKATCCSVCEENCHDQWGCWWVSPEKLYKCQVMDNNYCTVCTRKCHYSKHVKENKKYVSKTREVKMSVVDVEREYDHTDRADEEEYEKTKKELETNLNEENNLKVLEEKLKRDLENIKSDKSKLLHEAYETIMSLCDISLKADSAFTLLHLDFLIPRLKEEGKEECVKNLEDLRKTGEQKNKGLLHYMKYFFKPFNW